MKTNTQFRSVCAAAWRIVYHHPILWFYGLVASFVTYQWFHALLLTQVGRVASPQWLLYTLSGGRAPWAALLSGPAASPLALVTAACLAAVTILGLFIGSLAQVALIRRVSNADDGIGTREHTTSLAHRAVPVLLITATARILQYAVLILVHLPLFYALMNRSDSLVAAAVFGMLSFIAIAAGIQAVASYAAVTIAMGDEAAGLGISRGIELFSGRILRAYAITFWLLLARAGVTLLLICLAAVIAIPFGAAFLVAFTAGGTLWSGALAAGYFLCIGLLFVLARSVYSSYYVAVWTIAAKRAADGSLTAALARAATRITRAVDMDRARMEISRAEAAAARAYAAAKPTVTRAYRAAAPVVSREAKRAFAAAVAAIERKRSGKKRTVKKSKPERNAGA